MVRRAIVTRHYCDNNFKYTYEYRARYFCLHVLQISSELGQYSSINALLVGFRVELFSELVQYLTDGDNTVILNKNQDYTDAGDSHQV